MKFRKKPVVVEAEQYLKGSVIVGVCKDAYTGAPYIHTLAGDVSVRYGDWIITSKGEQYAMKPDLFRAVYEPAEVGG